MEDARHAPTDRAGEGHVSTDVAAVTARIQERGAFLADVVRELESVLVGQRALVDGLLVGLLADGHVLLEGLPGLAKTLTVKSLARTLGGTFRRIQFTPDLLPSDLVGTEVFDAAESTWSVREGPVFANVLLADEINRAPAKVQSALLEAMEERQVSLAGETRALPDPFCVLATQNPVEQEGTYPLPEAQVDRFLLKIVVDYPTRDEERAIVDRMGATRRTPTVRTVARTQDLLAARAVLDDIFVDPVLRDYVVDLVRASRDPAAVGLRDLAGLVQYGASPRASIALVRAARATAFLDGRGFVLPKDVKQVARPVLRHRLTTTFEAEAEGVTSEQVLERLLEAVPVP
ncbi:ATPase family associated with various cellular activities (AAA) [Planctomycetes bacterium Pla163]|uniref:ATPase family associated with various cellular activities (AAA) n=1 Tax=Rohdeia mirabilis TaxID=2528008 RepID=A0A518D0Q3_9BACT|nr:ATPase family associated with various cellular activities (AAA) [Planctomycetes bacterium Pla163]